MKYPLGPYANDELAVARHLPPDGRCLAVAYTVVVVVPLPGKPAEPLSRTDVLAALEQFRHESENKLTDRTLEVARGNFEVGATTLAGGEETVVTISLQLPTFETGEQIQ